MILKKADAPESWNLEAVDFINKCISRKPESRLGINGTPEVKSHVWLKDFDFAALLKHKEPMPPAKPFTKFVPN
jgi:serine/threonine protein kinase